MTGHDDGLITLNIAEADDVDREPARVSMHEPVRTLLGHLRHEVSHYLQQRYIDGTPRRRALPRGLRRRACRLFAGAGDALRERCAGRLVDPLRQRICQLAPVGGLGRDLCPLPAGDRRGADRVGLGAAPGRPRADRPSEGDAQTVPLEHLVLEHWLPVAQFLNAMNRSLGLPDSYPFLLPPAVLEKMSTVQDLLASAAAAGKPVAEQIWEGEGGALPDIGSQVPAAA